MEENSVSKRKFLNKKTLLLALFVIFVLGFAAYYFLVYQKNQTSPQNSNQAAAIEAQNLIEKVGKLIELPSEYPQIATVSDASKLPNQPFFAKAQNGDKVLIYNIAQKAILYRPGTNKIIDVAPLSVAGPTVAPIKDSATASASITATPTAQFKPTITP